MSEGTHHGGIVTMIPNIAGYDSIAPRFEAARRLKRWELPFFEALAGRLAPGAKLLDCGCGTGHAGLTSMVEAGVEITALDGSAPMLALFGRRYPSARTVLSDMLDYRPDEPFDAIIAWDSFFYLDHVEQERMLRRFAEWLRPGGLLLLTTGPGHSTVIGQMFGVDFSYASFAGSDYRALMGACGLSVEWDRFDEPGTQVHRVWLARKGPLAPAARAAGAPQAL
ncbi:class I SAM-dependent methyltransferase [Consotaella aegiceratis]|uniref:class I SAM-dependent methyltransferase n=1 Tax=Consotaella aegiceratis TaxID=3097961 RepID=UPI002F4072E5